MNAGIWYGFASSEGKFNEVFNLSSSCFSIKQFHCRQEFLGMQSKHVALKSQSQTLVQQQNNATKILSNLRARLSQLIMQLMSSYNISDDDLEVSSTTNRLNPMALLMCLINF